MKAKSIIKFICFCLLPAVCCLRAPAQGTAFTYSGEFIDSGRPATGLYDFQFNVYSTSSGAGLVAGPVVVSTVGVTNGLLMVTVDFGSGVFTGPDRWLDISVRTNGAAVFTSLISRQKFTASPYAIYSGQAGNANAVAASSVGITQLVASGGPSVGKVLGFDGIGLAWVDPSASSGWSLLGNAGITPGVNFLGTTDFAPVEIWANSVRAFRLEYARNLSGIVSPNVIGGYSANAAINGVIGTTIGGGGYHDPITGDKPNIVSAAWGTIGGGASNSVGGLYGVVGGGLNNVVSGAEATVPGGDNNLAAGAGSFAAGRSAHANHSGSFVWGDGSQVASSTAQQSWDVFASGGANFTTGANPLTVYGPWLVANGLGGEQAYIGGDGYGGDVQIGSLNSNVVNMVAYNAATGQFMNLTVKTLSITGGADVAEPFELSNPKTPQGSVVIIDDEHPGQLKLSSQPYDTHVAGVVSGANGIRPGISIHQDGVNANGMNVALSGRVYVQADTSNGPIKPGDLLTTSSVPGHAMKVTDHVRAQGAILGKAMSALDDGDGDVLMLVTLQ
jgi:hypothetical protein